MCGASPELALSVRGAALRTCPVKGTRPRGNDAERDARLAAALDADPKERAELTMAVDVHRNDLGRVAVPGSVRVLGEPRVLPGRTVWSRVAEVVARRAAGVTLADVARAVLPCGSITGAPKVRAMEVIALPRAVAARRLHRRLRLGWTRRAAGAGDGHPHPAMAVDRAGPARARRLEAEYFAGGGIVADSVPERELEETRWKAAQLAMLGPFGGKSIRGPAMSLSDRVRASLASALASMGLEELAARRPTSSSAPSAPSTAIWPPTSRWPSRRRPASRRASSPRRW